jgi:hypothetical protein
MPAIVSRGHLGGDHHVDVVGGARLSLEARGDGAGDHVRDPGSVESAGDELQ